MPLTPGTRIGVYEVTAQVGEGGMGQVYRATDTKLKRQVAIKILPDSFAKDAERLARFQREAEVLASLNHPHIAGIYGLEESAGALVMEFVDGEDLSQRIARGAVPADEAMSIAKQIAEALESAHERGIVHRDLKPANVKVRPDGTVKVLDFGLAKALDQGSGIGDQGSGGLANSPTITSPAMTRAGIILGTAAYMSPEQARGKVVDRRTDLWALGCVLFEMLTGTRTFDGETITDVLSAVVSKEPDWAKLPPATAPAMQRLLRRSLRKDVRTRLQSAGEARVELEEMISAPAIDSTATPAATRGLPWLAALAFTAAGAAIAFVAFSLGRPAPTVLADPPAMRFTIALPPTLSSTGPPTISPDGRWIAITAQGPTGGEGDPNAQLVGIWLRPIDGQTFQLIAGTDQAGPHIWSPDSRELAFFARGGTLNRIAITGGTPTRIAEVGPGNGSFLGIATPAAWGSDGTILLSVAGQIYRVPANGGALTQITTAEAGANLIRSAPSWLPGNRFLFSELASGVSIGEGLGGLFLQSLNGGAPVRLMDGRMLSRYTPDGLLTSRMTVTGMNVGTIRAHSFDIDRGVVEQPGVVLAADVNTLFGASDTGVLVYRRATAGADHRLQWVDRKGQPAGDGFDVSGSGPFNLSPDERLVAFQETNDLMVRDLARGVTTRLVQGPGVLEPIFSPNGRRVAYSKIVPPQMGIAVLATAGGPEEIIFKTTDVTLVEDWSRDGRFLLAIQSSGQRSPNRGLIIPLDGDRTPIVFADLPPGSGLDEPRFSHDGKWVVYNAAERGRQQVYLAPVPPTGERWQLSTAGGAQGRWRFDDGAVFYLSTSGQLMEVAVTKGQPPQIGAPQVLFETGLELASNIDQYLPSADAKRFLLRRPRGNAGGVELQVIVNWPTLLKQGPPK